jgi:hypothetical protein
VNIRRRFLQPPKPFSKRPHQCTQWVSFPFPKSYSPRGSRQKGGCIEGITHGMCEKSRSYASSIALITR